MYSQGRRNEANQISDDSPSESKNYGIARALVQQEEVLDLRLGLPALARLSRRDNIAEEPRVRRRAVKLGLEGCKMEVPNVGVRDKDIR